MFVAFLARRKKRRMEAWLAEYNAILQHPDVKTRFDAIYINKIWSRIGQTRESESGAGSTLKASRKFRRELPAFLSTLSPGILFDAPCGDYHVMGNVTLPEGWKYIGVDIAPSLIGDLNKKYPDVEFLQFDLMSDPFPQCSVWLCRACLFHLSYADIQRVLVNFSISSCDLALITTHVGIEENRDIVTGDYRPLDLTLPPFSLPKPATMLADVDTQTPPQMVGVWSRTEIAAALRRIQDD